MKSVLIAIKDERIIKKIRIALYDESIRYFYAQSQDEANHVCMDNEIYTSICDFDLFYNDGKRLFEQITELNSDTKIIILYSNDDLKEVADFYNSSSISYLLNKDDFIVEDIYKLTMSSVNEYKSNNDNYLLSQDDDFSSKFKTMNEMSSILNEKLDGYQSIINVYNDAIKFISTRSIDFLKPLRIYVDRILNDYIQLYMINSPDFDLYINSLNDSLNMPDAKKYFVFSSKCIDINEQIKNDILFAIDMITTCFNTFCKAYRGKLDLVSEGKNILINAIFDFREIDECQNIISSIMNINKELILKYSLDSQYIKNGNIVQYKVVFDNSLR